VRLPGGYAVICTRGQRAKSCKGCAGRADLLCDYPLRGKKEGKTCDAPICKRCAVVQGEPADDRQYCPTHARITAKAATP
jgi:hypothetical protein